jgi:prepilin-type N-terminal cleavage/methylation domain-containing protein
MKTVLLHSGRARSQQGMTLVEMMVNVVIFSMAIVALVTVNLFGQFQDELVNSTLGASDQTRVNFNQLLDEIRAGKNVQIGYGNYSNFVAITNGPMQGDTIQIWPTTNISVYIYYYFLTNAPTNSGWLCRAMISNYVNTNNPNVVLSNYVVSTNVMATCLTNMIITNVGGLLSTNLITNSMIFSALAFNQPTTNFVLLTNTPGVYSTYNYLVDVLLQFYQYQYPLTKVGSGSNYLFNYYQVELAAARRAE